MEFTIELDGIGVRYRLLKDRKWRKLLKDVRLQESDFRTTDASVVIRDSPPRDSSIVLDGVTYKVNPTVASLADNVLSSASSVIRAKFPAVPQLDQLRQAIRNGDDSQTNALVLNAQGSFELRPRPPYNISLNDPTVVVRHETFIAGNGYVGAEAAKHAQFIDEIYATSIDAWIAHLKTGKTQVYSELPSRRSVADLLSELENMRETWKG